MMVATLLWVCLTMVDDALQPGVNVRSVRVGTLDREYIVYVPRGYDAEKAWPVVLAFHGGGSNARQMMSFCGLNEKADQAGFLVVYPQGRGRVENTGTWNAGNCCGYAQRRNVDDVAFARTLLDELSRLAKIDEKRIYATGMSNGAMMSYLLASELADRIAAIAPVAGPMGTETCNPSRPVPVLHFHGTNDDFAPFEGGRGKRSITKTNFYSVEHSISNWTKVNGCPGEPTVVDLPNTANDGMSVTKKTYGPAKDGSEVVLVVIHGGGHTWPGQEPTFRFLGRSTKDISANDMMWEFFEKHPMR